MTGSHWGALGWGVLAATVIIAVPRGNWRIRAARLSGSGRLAPLAQPRPRARLGFGRAGSAAVGAVLVGGVWVDGGPVLAAAVSVALATAAAVIGTAVRRRGALRDDARYGDALRLIVAELQAGARLEQALHAAAEVDPESAWERSAHAVAAGDDPAELLLGCGRTGSVGHACRVASRSGAPLTDVLARLAADHAASIDQRRAVQAALAGAYASAAVLAVLPVVGATLGAAMGLHPLDTLLRTGAGHLLCFLGVAFDAVGVLWTSRIVVSAQR